MTPPVFSMWVVYLVVAVVAGFLIWQAFKEFREALRKDDKEKTNKHFRGKLLEYGILVVVGIVAAIVVTNLKGGPLSGLQERIWGYKQQTVEQEKIESPFYGDFGK